MRIITRKDPVVLENTCKNGDYFSLNVYPNNIPSVGKEPAKVGFHLVFPKDCIVEKFGENSIVIWRNLPEEDE